ncbi:MAG: ribonuclease H-like domain-containing protein [Chloroflexota bacterium]|nr:ribonuclease H-like domain-containing protein [Chloroflexota bacterium]
MGELTERRLWAEGFLTWADYLERGHCCALPSTLVRTIAEHVSESHRALAAGDARYFETRLPPGELWRLYSSFPEKVAFLDIETTGLYAGSDAITMIGLFDGTNTKVFVKGINLPEFAREIRNYSLLITFNGKRFDLPFIRQVFGELPPYQGHIDLLYPLRKLGYRGGLKSIEAQLGLEREGVLKDVNGFIAVLLWREYRRGNAAALETLIRYNLEDVVNLQYLADFAYNAALTRLPLSVKPLPLHPKFTVDTPFDTELIERLKRRILAMYQF